MGKNALLASAVGARYAPSMIGLLQRVSRANVVVDGNVIAAIQGGLLVLIGIEKGDAPPTADRLLERLLDFRVFADAAGRMNCSLRETAGGLLLVPQFTLAADTGKGRRPGFSAAAAPDDGRVLFEYLVRKAETLHSVVAAGRFGATMQVNLTNEGPVTFWLQVAP